MNTFEWEDGTIVERPYVEINGTKYYVQDGTISGGTPVSSTNLISMQNILNQNILDEFSDRFKILWYNENPTSISSATDITLNSDDYDFIIWMNRVSLQNQQTMFQFSLKGFGTRIYLGAGYRIINRNSDTSYTIGTYSDTSQPQNCIPIYAVGCKIGLFEGE